MLWTQGLLPTELPQKWLLDPAIITQRGMLVEVKGTFGDEGWNQGEYEGRQGIVLSITTLGKDEFASMAQLKLLEPANQPQTAVPIQYLWPVPPEKVDEDVLMLHGEYKGSLAKVYAVEGSSNMIVRTMPALVVVDTSPDTLVRCWNVDAEGNKIPG